MIGSLVEAYFWEPLVDGRLKVLSVSVRVKLPLGLAVKLVVK
jgi:hypothetical protein